MIIILILLYLFFYTISFNNYFNAILLLFGYLIYKRIKPINLLMKFQYLLNSSNENSDYNVEAYTIISCDYKKIFETLSNYKLMSQWDSFINCEKHLQELPDVL